MAPTPSDLNAPGPRDRPEGLLPVTLPTADVALEETGAAPLGNPKLERFCQHITNGVKPSDAYVLAGYAPGSRNVARAAAHKLLNDHQGVRARVDFLRAQVALAIQQRRERVVQELERIAYIQPTDVLTWTADSVTLKASADIDAEALSAIASVEQTKDGIRVRFHAKVDALDKLARIHRAYPVEDSGVGVNVVVVAPQKLTREEWLERYAKRENAIPE